MTMMETSGLKYNIRNKTPKYKEIPKNTIIIVSVEITTERMCDDQGSFSEKSKKSNQKNPVPEIVAEDGNAAVIGGAPATIQ
jgi:hypothetical protein